MHQIFQQTEAGFEPQGGFMDISLLLEILERKTATNMALGMNYAQALRAAQAEMLGKAERTYSRLGMFCLRARLAGAARSLVARRLERRR